MKTRSFYDWGNNCKLLEFDREQAAQCLSSGGATKDEEDMFWHGYLYGINEKIVPV
jgi:hypothetical protein